MATGWGHALQAAVGGFMKGRQMAQDWEDEKDEKAFRKEQRDVWRQERDDKKAERQALQDAFKPVIAQEVGGGQQGLAMVNDQTVGPPVTQATEPLDLTSPIAFKVGGKTYSDEAQARRAVRAANQPGAQMERAAGALRELGLVDKAMALEHSGRQAELSQMQLADARWKNDLGAAFAGGHEGLAKFAAQSTSGPLADFQVRVVPSEDGQSVTYMASDAEGAERPIGTFAAGRDGAIQAAYQFDRLVTPQQRMQHFEQQQQRAQEQANSDRSHGLQVATLNHRINSDDRNFGLRAFEAGQSARLSNQKIQMGEIELQQMLNSSRIPEGVKTQVSGWQKTIDEIDKALIKAKSDSVGYNPDAAGVKALEKQRAVLSSRINGAMAEYAPTRPNPRNAAFGIDDGSGGGSGSGGFGRMVDITLQSESGGRRYGADGRTLLTSPKGAQGEMQVMPGTKTDPGFGVAPARNNSPDELARVGRDYLQAMLQRYEGDPAKAWAAYNWGPGALDQAIRKNGDNWLASAPKETRDYVRKNMAALGQAPANPGVAVAAPAPTAPSLPIAQTEGSRKPSAPEPAPERQAKAAPRSDLPEAAEKAGQELDRAREDLAEFRSKPAPGLAAGNKARDQYRQKLKAAEEKVAEAERKYQKALPAWVKQASVTPRDAALAQN